MPGRLESSARSYVETLCAVSPNRTVGSPGNRAATDFFAHTIAKFGYQVEQRDFACIDWTANAASVQAGSRSFEVHASPYSSACRVTAPLVCARTVEALQDLDAEGKVLLLHGPITAEQLMPKNFVFYNPEHHQQLVALLEHKAPSAIISATGRNPEAVGALYPFPLIEDGDFDIPSEHMAQFMSEAAHTPRDTPEQVDCGKLVVLARGLAALVPMTAR
jgi:aminopeptidase YwaD